MDTANKGSLTFRAASTVREEVAEPVKARDDSEVSVSTGDSKTEVPVALYAEIKGLPYSAKYFELEGIWDNRDVGMKEELVRIDKAYRKKVQSGELADGKRSFEAFIKEAEKVTGSSMSPSHVRVSKIATYLSFMADLGAIDKKHGK